MAKQKKQKKSGLVKRQQAKINRKKEIKKKLQAKQAPPEKKITKSKLKKSLRELPSLIYEPELSDFRFSKEEIESAQKQHENIPDLIEALASEEFTASLKENVQAIDARFKRESNSNKGVMTMAVLYFMDQPIEKAPASLNQLVVAIFYQSVYDLEENSEPLPVKELYQKIQEYEDTWSDYVQQKLDAITQERVEDGEEIEETETDVEESPNESLIREFSKSLESKQKSEEQTDQIVEDVEALVLGYMDEFALEEISKLSPAKVRNFLESWFVQNMHPTKEDLSTMIDSLEAFFIFCSENQTITPEKFEKLMGVIQDKEGILSNLD